MYSNKVEKAQVSIETLVVALIVLIMGIYIAGYYTAIKDSTTAMEILKLAALKKIDALPTACSIQKITYEIAPPGIKLCLYSNPPGLDLSAEDGIIKQKIADATHFETSEIMISTSCS